MEQLDATVQRNADSAQQANQLAQGASDVAAKGGAFSYVACASRRCGQRQPRRACDDSGPRCFPFAPRGAQGPGGRRIARRDGGQHPQGACRAAHQRTGTIKDVQHIVILTQENRSFDHYFGALRSVRGFGDRRECMGRWYDLVVTGPATATFAFSGPVASRPARME